MRFFIGRIAALLSSEDLNSFRQALLAWFYTQQRDLPWRRSSEPYAVWISEIMLQQTRVAAVIPYYERFMSRFPDVGSLARAPEQELLVYWAGLGYYHRARNLQRAAKAIVSAGAFPRDYDNIRSLPGIGDYTASAVASISFDLPRAVLDGNVFRVLSRLFVDATNIASTVGKRQFARLADNLLDTGRPGAFNQSMMELGATVCLPKNPQCLVCPVSNWCMARETGTQNTFPVKIVPRKSVPETRILFWAEHNARVLAWQRSPNSRLMPGFWELPEQEHLPDAVLVLKLGSFRHGITFHNYLFEVWSIAIPCDPASCQWIDLASLQIRQPSSAWSTQARNCQASVQPLLGSFIEDLPISTVFRKARRVVSAPGNPKETARSAVASPG